LAHEAPMVCPPPELKKRILDRLPVGRTAFPVSFISQWIPYIIAICLMMIGIGQTKLILDLQSQLLIVRSEVATLRESNGLMQLHLTTLQAKEPAYAMTKVLVAWDPHLYRGVISLENLPAPPPGYAYQLWVLDPAAEAPMSAGLISMEVTSHRFAVHSVSTENPGFAISLEAGGAHAVPTGSILFAVAPML
jgi:hypothetical protein